MIRPVDKKSSCLQDPDVVCLLAPAFLDFEVFHFSGKSMPNESVPKHLIKNIVPVLLFYLYVCRFFCRFYFYMDKKEKRLPKKQGEKRGKPQKNTIFAKIWEHMQVGIETQDRWL